MEEERTIVISDIRACLISTKGAVSLRQLERDYKTIVGHRIPFGKFGYQTLEDFLQSDPSLILSRSSGEVFVEAKRCQKSAHIVQLVNKQKKVKLKKFTQRSQPRLVQTTNWRPKFSASINRQYQRSSRVEQVSHNQFVNVSQSYEESAFPSRVVTDSVDFYTEKPSRKIDNSAKCNLKILLKKNEKINKNFDKDNISKQAYTSNNQVSRQFVNERAFPDFYTGIPLKKIDNTAKRNLTILHNKNDKSNKNFSNNQSCSVNTDKISSNYISSLTISKKTEDTNNNLRNINLNIPISPPKIPGFALTGDPVVDLKKFVEYFKIGPLHINTKRHVLKKNFFITCLIKIGKQNYTSYPREFNTERHAELYCADIALKELMPKYTAEKSQLIANTQDILERIPPMLEKHSHGMWVWQLELDYEDKYKEKLPGDWLKTVDSSPKIQLEKCFENYIIRYCKPGDVARQKRNTFLTLSDVSIPSNTVHFDEDSKLFAEITCVKSADEIWCVQYSPEESKTFGEMIVKMELFYNINASKLKTKYITIGSYYIAKYDNEWCRVRAIQEDDGIVLCFLIDYGDVLVIAKDDIYQLKREFAQCQAQAFVCRLSGLEDLYEASEQSEVLQNILHQEVVLELANDVKVEEDVTLSVYMYSVKTGKSINKEMISLLSMETASLCFQKDMVFEVHISNVEPNGDIYVQHRSHGNENFKNLLRNLENRILDNPPTDLVKRVTKNDNLEKMYLIKNKTDGHFKRIQIIDWAPNGEFAQIYAVDIGTAEVIRVQQEVLYPLDKLSDILNQFPFQANKVRMTIDKIPKNFTELVRKVLSEDETVLMKITDYDVGIIPRVEFFKRNLDGSLFCLNKSVTMEAELKLRAQSKKNTGGA